MSKVGPVVVVSFGIITISAIKASEPKCLFLRRPVNKFVKYVLSAFKLDC